MTSFFKSILYFFIVVIILIFIISFSFFSTFDYSKNISNLDGIFIWPLPNNSYISSYFGKRVSPTSGASSYHSGIDIPAIEGTSIYSVCSGTVTFAGWGAGGRIYYCSFNYNTY